MPTWITQKDKDYFELVDNYKEDLSSCTIFELPTIVVTYEKQRYNKMFDKLLSFIEKKMRYDVVNL